MTLLMRSTGIVELVWSTGTTPDPSVGRRFSDWPGWQSTKYSPIKDWGRISQVASSRKSVKPGWEISAIATALAGSPFVFMTSNFDVLPARTPPTRKSPPSTRPKVLSKTIR